ncbi:MAG: hypothetical protein ACI80V_002441 [Rhodothermales bacterium]
MSQTDARWRWKTAYTLEKSATEIFCMATRKRKGMWIKNTHTKPVEIEMATRTVQLEGGQQLLISAEEVRDVTLRAKLQVRAVSIVRPSSDEEEEALVRELTGEGPAVTAPTEHIPDPPEEQ